MIYDFSVIIDFKNSNFHLIFILLYISYKIKNQEKMFQFLWKLWLNVLSIDQATVDLAITAKGPTPALSNRNKDQCFKGRVS